MALLSAADTEPSICRSAGGTEPSLCPFVHSAGCVRVRRWECTLVQTVPQTLRRVERRDVIRSGAQNSVGPATSRPVLALGPVHETPFGSRRVERKCGIEVNVITAKTAMLILHSI